MEPEIVKFLIAHIPNWGLNFLMLYMILRLFSPQLKDFLSFYSTLQQRSQGVSCQDEKVNENFRELQARKKFFQDTGIYNCPKNLRDGLIWFHNRSDNFSWKYICSTKKYIKQRNGVLFVKISWLDIATYHINHVCAAVCFLLAFWVLYIGVSSSNQLSSSAVILSFLYLLFASCYFICSTFPIWRAKKIAKEIETLTGHSSYIPTLFEPVYKVKTPLVSRYRRLK